MTWKFLLLLSLIVRVGVVSGSSCKNARACQGCVDLQCIWIIPVDVGPAECISYVDYDKDRVKMRFRTTKACQRFPGILEGLAKAFALGDDARTAVATSTNATRPPVNDTTSLIPKRTLTVNVIIPKYPETTTSQAPFVKRPDLIAPVKEFILPDEPVTPLTTPFPSTTYSPPPEVNFISKETVTIPSIPFVDITTPTPIVINEISESISSKNCTHAIPDTSTIKSIPNTSPSSSLLLPTTLATLATTESSKVLLIQNSTEPIVSFVQPSPITNSNSLPNAKLPEAVPLPPPKVLEDILVLPKTTELTQLTLPVALPLPPSVQLEMLHFAYSSTCPPPSILFPPIAPAIPELPPLHLHVSVVPPPMRPPMIALFDVYPRPVGTSRPRPVTPISNVLPILLSNPDSSPPPSTEETLLLTEIPKPVLSDPLEFPITVATTTVPSLSSPQLPVPPPNDTNPSDASLSPDTLMNSTNQITPVFIPITLPPSTLSIAPFSYTVSINEDSTSNPEQSTTSKQELLGMTEEPSRTNPIGIHNMTSEEIHIMCETYKRDSQTEYMILSCRLMEKSKQASVSSLNMQIYRYTKLHPLYRHSSYCFHLLFRNKMCHHKTQN